MVVAAPENNAIANWSDIETDRAPESLTHSVLRLLGLWSRARLAQDFFEHLSISSDATSPQKPRGTHSCRGKARRKNLK